MTGSNDQVLEPAVVGMAVLDLSVDIAGALRKAARDLLDAANNIETKKLETAPDPRTSTEREADEQAAASREVDVQGLYASLDAAVWAAEFMKVAERVKQDEGAMIGWFANCIETAKTLSKQSLARQVRALGIEAPEHVTNTLELGTFYRDAIASIIEQAS